MSLSYPLAVTLLRYSQRVGYRECAFFGVAHPDNIHYACGEIWTKAQRDMIEWALTEAQGEIENELGYPLAPRWITDERIGWASRLFTRWGHMIEPGVMDDTMLSAGEAVDHTSDPAVIGPVALGTCDVADARLFFAGTDQEIEPASVAEAASAVTFGVPWCRLVAPAYQDNPAGGLDYNDHATWIAGTVDVRCIANDPGTQATLIWRTPISANCTVPCTDERKTGCIYVREPILGVVDVRRADYSAGAWTAKTCCPVPDWVLLNYRAGVETLTPQMEDMIIRLAHAKMAEEPCGCDVTQRLWKRDRNVPEILTRERINCPFGMSDGAWWAYRQAQTLKIVRGSVL